MDFNPNPLDALLNLDHALLKFRPPRPELNEGRDQVLSESFLRLLLQLRVAAGFRAGLQNLLQPQMVKSGRLELSLYFVGREDRERRIVKRRVSLNEQLPQRQVGILPLVAGDGNALHEQDATLRFQNTERFGEGGRPLFNAVKSPMERHQVEEVVFKWKR